MIIGAAMLKSQIRSRSTFCCTVFTTFEDRMSEKKRAPIDQSEDCVGIKQKSIESSDRRLSATEKKI